MGRPELVPVFTGLSVRQFGKLVGIVRRRGAEQAGAGRRWGLSLEDRVLLVAVYYRTNLTLRQVAPLFGISKSAAGRVVDHLAPHLTLAPVRRKHSPDTVVIVDGTLVPVHDRSVSASSKNYRYSAKPTGLDRRQHEADGRGRRPVAGQPQRLPGLYRIRRRPILRRRAGDGRRRLPGQSQCDHALPQTPRRQRTAPWKQDLNTVHKRVRARVEHSLAHMKSWNVLRNCRRKGRAVYYATSAVALMRNLAMTF